MYLYYIVYNKYKQIFERSLQTKIQEECILKMKNGTFWSYENWKEIQRNCFHINYCSQTIITFFKDEAGAGHFEWQISDPVYQSIPEGDHR